MTTLHARWHRSDWPTVEYVRGKLAYNPKTGILTWKWVGRGPGKVGGEAGSYCLGYRKVPFGKIAIASHILAWAIMTGEWPSHRLDHINTQKDDNRWSNLRLAPGSANNQNVGVRRDNTSGVKGVWRHGNRWTGCVQVDGARHNIGSHMTIEAAAEAYAVIAARYHGPFARVS